MTPEQQLQAVISKLPRSVVDFHEDGSISVHGVDMVQAQMDREKHIANITQRLIDALRKVEELEAKLAGGPVGNVGPQGDYAAEMDKMINDPDAS